MGCLELFIFENGQPMTTPPPKVYFWAFRLTVRRFFTQRACFSAVADCTSTISWASLFQSRVTTLPATLKTCSDLEDAAGMAKITLKIGARMDNGLQKIIEKSVYYKVKIPNQNKTLTSALTYCLPRPAPTCPAPKMPRPVNFDPCPRVHNQDHPH